jgi:dihydroflavonol-4-reductase
MILVTGGTGLVGAHILYDLCLNNERIRAIKRSTSNLYLIQSLFEYYSPKNHILLFDKINWVDADLNDIDSLIEVTQNVDYVYHAAAVVSFHEKDAKAMIQANINGTANLMNACKSNGVKKVGHISSVAALGPSKNGESISEDNQWQVSKDNSVYSISKYGAEREVWRVSEEGVDVVMVNPSLILGPGDWNSSSTHLFKMVFNGLKFYTLGSTGFVDVRDVSRTIIDLVHSDVKSQRFLLSAENLVWKDVFSMIANAFNVKPPSIKVTKLKAEIAWRILKFSAWFTGNPPKATKESAQASLRTRQFSSAKITRETGLNFINMKTSITDSIDFIQRFYIAKK